MKTFLIILIIGINGFSLELKKGDILLQPLHCRLCNLIEAQTDSIYSHIGIALDEDTVAEAFISVRAVSVGEFKSKTQKNQKIKVLRPKFELGKIKSHYFNQFDGNSYDSEFRWNNYNEKGEMIYCSELVYKLLKPYSYNIPEPLPMLYDVNPTLWDKFFKDNTPRGKLGISPAMFDREDLFEFIGEL